jgi:hypothetical protein
MMEARHYGTIDELAAAEKINSSYVSRLLRLTLLALTIVEAILDGRHPEGVTLRALMEPFPVEWQRRVIPSRSISWEVSRSACATSAAAMNPVGHSRPDLRLCGSLARCACWIGRVRV